MGLIARASGTLEVLAAEPFSISLDPVSRSVRQNDAVQTLSYRVLFDRAGGYAGPVYLEVIGFAGRESFDVNPIPEGAAEALLTFDTADMPVGLVEFDVVAYEDPADYPGGWPPEVVSGM
jgi:hypothetical protein